MIPKQIPKSKVIQNGDIKAKAPCDGCGLIYRASSLIFFKGLFLCCNCRHKTESFRAQTSAISIGRNTVSLEAALGKTYRVHTYVGGRVGKETKKSMIFVPTCLTDKEVKITLVDKDTTYRE